MDSANPNSWQTKLVTRVGKAFRSNKSYNQAALDRQYVKEEDKRDGTRRRLQRAHGHPISTLQNARRASDVNELGEREYSIFSDASTLVEKPKDHTEMMHGLAHLDEDQPLDSVGQKLLDQMRGLDRMDAEQAIAALAIIAAHERRVASIPEAVWQRIASYLNPCDAASLASASRTLLAKLGPAPFEDLRKAENKHYRVKYLQYFDRNLADMLFCFPCSRYHRRTSMGNEVLKADFVTNPLFNCPNVKSSVLPRTRIAYGRELPYAFIQLVLRAHRHSPKHGIQVEKLSRRWKCPTSGWTHRTRYLIHDDRLLMRVVSQNYAPPAATATETTHRHLLYDRNEYVPYFSVCAHWRDGDLMRLCKCALSHVPAPPDPVHKQLQRGFKVSRAAARPNFIVRGCDDCRPARRCPECPTEYLVEIQMTEDLADPVRPFKHAIVVTRWTDLGDGSSPLTSPEWVAINGLKPADGAVYQSFSNVGRRAVGGTFESAISGTVPGQRLLSLNPKNKKLGEEGNG